MLKNASEIVDLIVEKASKKRAIHSTSTGLPKTKADMFGAEAGSGDFLKSERGAVWKSEYA